MKEKIPFNFYSIDDIDKWRNDFFFPLSLKTCERIEKELCSLLISQYSGIGERYKIHYRIASKALILESYDLLIKLVLANEMKKRDDSIFILSNHRLPPDINLPKRNITFDLYMGKEDIDFPNLELKYNDPFYLNISHVRRVGQYIKSFVEYNLRRNKRDIDNYVVIPNDTTLQYLSKIMGDDFFLLRPLLIFKESLNKKIPYKVSSDFFTIASLTCSKINSVLYKNSSINIPDKIKQSFEKSIHYLFNRIDFELGIARKFCSKYIKPKSDLYTGTAKHFTRVLGEVIRERGGKTIAFPHEGGLSGLNLPVLSFTEFATCDSFVCFDELDAIDYKKYPTINSINFPVIKGLGESGLNIEKSKLKKAEKIDINSISTIMYVFFGQHIDNFGSSTRNDLIGFDLQLKIIDNLIKLGKKILFKNRPKSLTMSNKYNHFGYFNDKIDYSATPLDQVLNKADLFILEGVGTKSLHEIMTLTNKPIILFKTNFPQCTGEYENQLNKRCYVIELYEDSKNRLCFDEASLKGLFKYEN